MSGRDLFGRPLPTSSSSAASSSARPPSLDPNEAIKREAFRKLKPTCVTLMGLAGTQPTSATPHAAVIDTLRAAVQTLPDAAFSPALINYLLFPLTTTLRQSTPSALPDNFLEAAFRLLTLVVRHWKAAPPGMEPAVWEQLWRFAVSAMSTPGDKGKGKARQVGEEVSLEGIRLLDALLSPTASRGVVHPSPAMRKSVSGPTAPLVPTLFQSISIAVDASTPLLPHPTLQRAAVGLLPTLLSYLAGQSSLLASVLPGVVSAMSKAISREGKNLKGDIAAGMAGTIKDTVVETLDDDELRRLCVLDPEFADLADLANNWNQPQDVEDETDDHEHEPATPGTGTPKRDPFPPLTEKYLAFTAQQLQSTVPAVLSTLTAHTSHEARMAAGELAAALLTHCAASLPRLQPPSLSTLLLLSTDDFQPVSSDATARLSALLRDDKPELDTALVDLLSGAINALPRLIKSQQDARVDEVARLVTAIAKLTSADAGRPNAIAAFLGPAGMVERWAWALLDCLEFGRPRGWSSMANTAARTAALGWSRGLVTSSLPLLIDSSSSDATGTSVGAAPGAKFPHLTLAHVESEKTSRDLAAMLQALGAAGGEAALHSIDYMVRFAKAHRTRDTPKAVSAVWVAEQLLRGVATNPPTKALRKMAKTLARALVDMDEAEDEDAEWDGPDEAPEEENAVVRTKGVDQLTTLLDKDKGHKTAADETRKLHARAQRVLLSAVSLSALSASAHVLGHGFRPLLLHALYLVLAQLSSPHELVRTYAEVALVRIAYDTGYASAQNLVLDNVDYVVNVVSQRLTYHRLSPHAPLVLIAMIRLVGAPIVPLVHDVVDEIFDALDDFHGYAALASALLAVLTTLVDAMGTDEDVVELTPERKAAKEDAARFLAPPDPKADFKFAAWYAERSARAQAEVDEILARAPQQAWGDLDNKDKMDEDERPAEENGPPLTRTQDVCVQIVTKATYYLSHGSPFLRARVLGLITRAIPVLANGGHEGALLPVIDQAWSSILLRLDDLPYVATEAAGVVAALAKYVGDYVSKRIADDAWPKLLKLLKAQMALDSRSALARRGAPGTITEHSVAHRLYASILDTAAFIVSEVPVKDALLWDMVVVFRALLDRRAHAELQDKARIVYRALMTRDADAVWVVMRATMSGGGLWSYLADEGLDIGDNVRALGL